VGKLLNGRVFDTSIESVARDNNIFSENRNYIPLRFILGRGQLIEGFESAIAIMEAGDKATVIMPSIFGYGGAAQGDIPPNSPLIFELDFIELKKGPQQ
jgi:FKBP-type peptidyl-prolyl cis-trans isomerase